ncbi:purine-binding chemotaxis protein CheW [Methanoplanus sp. FWC-SCC4]|uniref:Purine-binding chemotaxis protein CheW n=1 Tax=Methanochimaera problematica TaxID=2609417 RepID=A0AA97FF49_9EURY|nr:chemotaxis protein CheW [Methanoplanus sp. FWC-SCC4]WOF17044.1 purine-binding chemotaxis protein CheW [Methanoplanus sp. FWC-SCC4]
MTIIDIVEFEIGNEHYALDINLAREIVEMVEITPVPRAPDIIAGIINLRGEITNIINLSHILNLKEKNERKEQKIIVLVPEAAEGSNVGIIVDDVQSVLQVSGEDIEAIKGDLAGDAYVRGVIKVPDSSATDDSDKSKKLIIWLDIGELLHDMLESAKRR